MRAEYLDPGLIVDPVLRQRLVDGGMDSLLATHFAHLFIRDPIVVFAEDLQHLNLAAADHFENLQSTNWQHMRFKPPPPGSDTGWRVEFRPMEIQLTDFENAAFSIFIVLVTRAILSFDLDFYIPIARVTENMETAHVRDAVNGQQFWFRKNPFPEKYVKSADEAGSRVPSRPASPKRPVEDEYTLMSIDEIINGQTTTLSNGATSNGMIPSSGRASGEAFPGLIPLVESYLDSVNVDVETRCELAKYLSLISKRASGELWTAAKWLRGFVRGHEDYQGDSVVNEQITFDLVKAAERVAQEEGRDGFGKEMFGR